MMKDKSKGKGGSLQDSRESWKQISSAHANKTHMQHH